MDLCIDCLNDLPWIGQACLRCTRPLHALPDPAAAPICGRCADDAAAPDCSLAALIYEYPVPGLIAGLKYRRKTELARVLAELLAVAVSEAVRDERIGLPDALVPMPLHPVRQFRRGFNQAELLARVLGRELGIEVRSELLQRVRHTPHQTGLGRRARSKNVRACFRASARVRGQHIAVIDDVLTTGATLREAIRVLRAEGCERADTWVVATAG
jgi:ComF family protein